MNESLAAHQPAAHPVQKSGRDWVLVGKLGPPRQRVATSARLALLQRLDQALELPLTVITSPAGFGKSTLLAQWHQRLVAQQVPVAWLSLGEDDGEVSRFVAYLSLAVSAAGVDIGPLLQTAQAQLHDIDARSAIAALMEHIRDAPDRLVIILDDYDTLASKEVDDLVLALVEHCDPRLHIVLSGREAPSFPLSGFIVRGLMERIESADMALGIDEAMQFFSDSIPADTVRWLHGYTEGWSVALQLAALWAASEGGDPGERLRKGFSGNSREVAAYLAEQVVGRLDDELRGFILKTSILSRFDVSLANEVCGRDDSAAQLRKLGAFLGLLIPLDGQQEWFRYHHLFAEYLRALLQRTWPAQVNVLHQRAASGLFERGDLLEAVKHANRAGATDLAAGFMAQAGGWELVLNKGPGYVRPLLRHFPATVIRNHPILNVTQAYLHIRLGEFQQAQLLLEHYPTLADAMLHAHWQGYITVRSLLEDYQDHLLSDPQRIGQIKDYIARVGDQSLVGATLHCVCAVGELGRGDFGAVAGHSQLALDGMRGSGNVMGIAYAMFHLGQSHFYRGQLDEAEAIYRESLLIADAYFGVDSALKACGECLLAQVLYWRGDVAEAAALIDVSLPFLEGNDGWLDLFAAAYEVKLAVVRSRQAADEAVLLLDHVGQVATRRNLLRLGELLRAWRLDVALDAPGSLQVPGDVEWTQALDRAFAQPHHWRQQTAMTLATVRQYTRSGKTAIALTLLQRLEDASEDMGRALDTALVRAHAALIHQQRGDLTLALASFGPVLDYVQAQRAWQVLLGLGPPAKALLHLAQQHDLQARAGSVRSRCIQQVLGRFGGQDGEAELLSARETEILVSVCQGHSNKLVARALNLSENTVKFHLKSIFRKLGVESRSAAVAAAHERDLLP